jgi:hypothetical protein
MAPVAGKLTKGVRYSRTLVDVTCCQSGEIQTSLHSQLSTRPRSRNICIIENTSRAIATQANQSLKN